MALTRQTDKTRTTTVRTKRSRQDEPTTLIRLIHAPSNNILPFPIQFGVLRLKALTLSGFEQALRASMESGKSTVPLFPTDADTHY